VEALHGELLLFLIPPHRAASAFTPEFLAAAAGYDAEAVLADYLARCPSDDWRDRLLYVDAKTYLAGLLALEDKLSMAHSLETRVPLLDNELVDFLLDVPFDHLYRGGTGKRLFRESVRPWVPEEVFRKPKMGFGPPDRSWYRGPLRPWIEDRLGPRGLEARGVFQPAFLRETMDAHFSGRSDATPLLWSLLSFDAWCRSFGAFGGVPGPV
jgi:asparagine synthase (glutamine-hydrolysing)